MGDFSSTAEVNSNQHSPHAVVAAKCSVCMDKKYVLVARKKLGQSSTLYERHNCHACDDENTPENPEEKHTPQAVRKVFSGTGYLRNKKRRRKEAD